jgi:hypothetical protein
MSGLPSLLTSPLATDQGKEPVSKVVPVLKTGKEHEPCPWTAKTLEQKQSKIPAKNRAG